MASLEFIQEVQQAALDESLSPDQIILLQNAALIAMLDDMDRVAGEDNVNFDDRVVFAAASTLSVTQYYINDIFGRNPEWRDAEQSEDSGGSVLDVQEVPAAEQGSTEEDDPEPSTVRDSAEGDEGSDQ